MQIVQFVSYCVAKSSFSLFMYILTASLFMVHLPLIHIYIFKEKQKLPSSRDQDWTAKCF